MKNFIILYIILFIINCFIKNNMTIPYYNTIYDTICMGQGVCLWEIYNFLLIRKNKTMKNIKYKNSYDFHDNDSLLKNNNHKNKDGINNKGEN